MNSMLYASNDEVNLVTEWVNGEAWRVRSNHVLTESIDSVVKSYYEQLNLQPFKVEAKTVVQRFHFFFLIL